MTNATVALPTSTTIKHVGDETIAVEWADIPANVLAQVLVTGAKTMLINTWNSGGKDVPESERAANLKKKIDAWKRGEINVSNRGAAHETLMRDAYRLEVEKANGAPITDAAWVNFQAEAVKAAGGKVTKGRVIPFDVFVESRAKVLAKREGEKRDAETIAKETLERFELRAHELAAERAKATADVDVSGLDF